MAVTREPKLHDVVVDHDGVFPFLTPSVTRQLSRRTLRAQLEQRPAFYLG